MIKWIVNGHTVNSTLNYKHDVTKYIYMHVNSDHASRVTEWDFKYHIVTHNLCEHTYTR